MTNTGRPHLPVTDQLLVSGTEYQWHRSSIWWLAWQQSVLTVRYHTACSLTTINRSTKPSISQ